MDWSSATIFAAEILGVIAFSISGSMQAIRKNLDIFGVIILGVATACGGGVLRDILLGKFPPLMFVKFVYAAVAVATAVALFIIEFKGGRLGVKSRPLAAKIFILIDAIGLGAFTVVGTKFAMDGGFADNCFFAVVLGVITGIGGGIIRDVFTGVVPLVFREDIYALASIIGSLLFFWLVTFGVASAVAMIVGSGAVVALRLLSVTMDWHLPRVK